MPLVDEASRSNSWMGPRLSIWSKPGTSSRGSTEMQMSRPMMSQQVLGTEALFLPDDHPLHQMVGRSRIVQGRIVASSSAPTLTSLELSIHLDNEEANALVSSLMKDHGESPIFEGVVGPVVLPGA
jgi:hypothetical protein